MRALNVLTLNSGSSSLKFSLHHVDARGPRALLAHTLDATDTASAMGQVADVLSTSGTAPPDAVAHRIVHGGPTLTQPCPIDDEVLRQLQAASVYAPLHTPPALALLQAARTQFPGLPQVAAFDTGFHADLPEVARVLPIARGPWSAGMRRYGFHGLSLESVVHQLGDDVPARLVVAHLGNGASVTAVGAGRSVDTSMGLTPSGGVVMGTRSGDLDPGVLLYLMREHAFDVDGLEALVNRGSGLLGISGVSGDMRRLHEAAASMPGARLAIEVFVHTVRKQVAAMAAVLGGLDMLVFTGGIGENDPQVRRDVCDGLGFIGIVLDDARNEVAARWIHADASPCRVGVMPSREDEQLARHAWAVLA